MSAVGKSASEILTWVAEVFESPAERISPETRRDEIEAWDSLGILTLIAKMDEEIATFEAKINEACSQKEMNFYNIIELREGQVTIGEECRGCGICTCVCPVPGAVTVQTYP